VKVAGGLLLVSLSVFYGIFTYLSIFLFRDLGMSFGGSEMSISCYNGVCVPKDAHDRFMLIDGVELYHIGASLKDLGKKWFAFSRMEMGSLEILERLR